APRGRFADCRAGFSGSFARSNEVHGPARRHALDHCANPTRPRHCLVLHRSRQSGSARRERPPGRPSTTPSLLLPEIDRVVSGSFPALGVAFNARRTAAPCLPYFVGAYWFLEVVAYFKSREYCHTLIIVDMRMFV